MSIKKLTAITLMALTLTVVIAAFFVPTQKTIDTDQWGAKQWLNYFGYETNASYKDPTVPVCRVNVQPASMPWMEVDENWPPRPETFLEMTPEEIPVHTVEVQWDFERLAQMAIDENSK